MKTGRAARYYRIKPELLKCMGKKGIEMLSRLLSLIRKGEKLPRDWTVPIILQIYKKEDNKACHNRRSISLLCTEEKLYMKLD